MNRGAPHGKCLKACLLTASLPSFLGCDLAVRNPVRHFSSWKKVAAFSSASLPPSLLQCKQLSEDRDIAAWLTTTTQDYFPLSGLRSQVQVQLCPFLPSFFPLCISVEAAKVHQSQRNHAAAAAAFAPSSILLPGICTQPLAVIFPSCIINAGSLKH